MQCTSTYLHICLCAKPLPTRPTIFNGVCFENMYDSTSTCWYGPLPFLSLRPVTMGGQKFEIPEDPSQTLPERSPMDPIWSNCFLKLGRIFAEFRGKTISRGDLGQDWPKNLSSRSWIRRGVFRVLHTLRSTKSTTASCSVNSERGDLVRGSDRPLV